MEGARASSHRLPAFTCRHGARFHKTLSHRAACPGLRRSTRPGPGPGRSWPPHSSFDPALLLSHRAFSFQTICSLASLSIKQAGTSGTSVTADGGPLSLLGRGCLEAVFWRGREEQAGSPPGLRACGWHRELADAAVRGRHSPGHTGQAECPSPESTVLTQVLGWSSHVSPGNVSSL